MKKVLSLFIALTLAFTAISFTVSAASEELIENGGFEEGDTTGWSSEGNCANEVIEDAAHSGTYGLSVFDRRGQYAGWGQDITDEMIECGPGKYKASIWCRLEEADPTAKCMIVVRVTTKTGQKYFSSGYKPITTEWAKYSFEQDIMYDLDSVSAVRIYPQCFNGENKGVNMQIDDLSLVKTSEINGRPVEKLPELPNVTMEAIDVINAQRSETTTLGAIRWDAWYGHDATDISVLKQVEKSLSPAKYHFRAPFFATVTEKNEIYIPTYTQEIFDKEMEYAIDAGIDYFAYVWYEGSMGIARDFHTKSKYKTQVKMCAVMDGNAIGKQYARKEMLKLLKEDYYMTVLDGRPLMYYFGTSDNIKAIGEDIKYYRRVCKYLGIPEPYAVVMNHGANVYPTVFGDAVSRYATGLSGGVAFRDLMQKAYEDWDSWRKSGSQFVPSLTAGWHNGTRYENPVSWGKVNEDSWVQYATADEIQEHIEYMYRYMQQPVIQAYTKANTAVLYAWNEHDEGGWICPTITVDETGKQIMNADGTPKINDERIQAVKRATTKYKNGELAGTIDLSKLGDGTVTGSINGDSNGNNTNNTDNTDNTETTPPPADGSNKGWVLPTVIGASAAAVVAGAVAVIIVVTKKQKTVKKDEE